MIHRKPAMRTRLGHRSFDPPQLLESLARQWREGREAVADPGASVWFALPRGSDAVQGSARVYDDLPRRFHSLGMQPVPLEKAPFEKRMPERMW